MADSAVLSRTEAANHYPEHDIDASQKEKIMNLIGQFEDARNGIL